MNIKVMFSDDELNRLMMFWYFYFILFVKVLSCSTANTLVVKIFTLMHFLVLVIIGTSIIVFVYKMKQEIKQ